VAWASAQFVAATGADNVPVIATPPTPVPTATRVPPTPRPATPTPLPPPPTAVPPPQTQINFWADRTQINQGECATLFWDVRGVQAVWVYPRGADFTRFPVTGQGSRTECPTVTTTYEMRVLLNDGSTQFRQVTINVIQPIAPPVPPTVAPAPTQPIAPPQPPIAVDALAGTRWEVTNFNNGQGAVVGLLPGTKITLDFGMSQQGQVSGRAGCNTYFGPYVADGNFLTVSRPATTSLACESDVMLQEQQYLAALQSSATFQITGDQLQIRTAQDQGAVTANRVR
jgi:heat shock protein HslJ